VHKLNPSYGTDILFKETLSLSLPLSLSLSLIDLSLSLSLLSISFSPFTSLTYFSSFSLLPIQTVPFLLFRFAQVSVAALLDNFIASSARMEEKERLHAAEEATQARHVRVQREREKGRQQARDVRG
jgi:hypothetical protein